MRWADLDGIAPLYIYAGHLPPDYPQFATYYGLSPFVAGPRNIDHDLLRPMPLPDHTVDRFQVEDVLEHIEYDCLPGVIDEIHRVLKPGGLFRLSVPDYRFDVYRDRCLTDAAGSILFDPGGGGRYQDGTVIDGGHLWFPVHETVMGLLARTRFATQGRIDALHFTAADGTVSLRPIDHDLGRVVRTPDHDSRSRSPRRPQSIVVDCYKA